MLLKTKGIVFRFTRYGETSIIASIFTAQLGLRSFMVNGVRTTSARSKMALFQPLTLLDLVVYYKENANLLRLKEVKCLHPYQTVNHNIVKSSVAMFLGEVMNRAVKEESHAEELCEFLIQSFITLDEISAGAENFHLVFLICLSKHLGFGVQHERELPEAAFLSAYELSLLQQLLAADYHSPLTLPAAERRNLLQLLLQFYRAHIENFGDLKSVAILREVLQ
jgi:DNA repair protein RecO (recombination protein O)